MHKLYRQRFFLLASFAMVPILLCLTILTIGALAQKPIKEVTNNKTIQSTAVQSNRETIPKKLEKPGKNLNRKQSLGQLKQAVIAQNQTAIPAWHEIKNLESLSNQQRASLATLYRPYKQRLRSLKEQLQTAIKEENSGTRNNSIPSKDNKNPNITVGEATLLGSLEPEEFSGSESADRTAREQASNAEVRDLFARMIATKRDAWNHLQPLLTRAQVKEVTASATARMRSKLARTAHPVSKSEQETVD